jgi:hypothetical protein
VAREHRAAGGVGDDDVLGVRGDEGVDVAGVVGVDLGLDRIHPVSSRWGVGWVRRRRLYG